MPYNKAKESVTGEGMNPLLTPQLSKNCKVNWVFQSW